MESLDALALKFVDAASSSRDSLVKDAIAFGEDAKHYVRVMQKVLGSSEEYIVKEIKRCVRLFAIA